jgi:glycosyltransferase involved in cell wall biosynthesis
MSNPIKKLRLLIFIVAYNAEKTIAHVLSRIPTSICEIYEVEVLIIDDASTDATFTKSNQFKLSHSYPFPITIFKNPINQGYGGNQKTCYRKALDLGADIIIMLHPDYQYTPKLIPAMAHLVATDIYPVVLGSRILGKGALEGGMPMVKYIANRILTLIQNIFINQKLSEYHTGYRAFSREVLESIRWDLNSDDFIFDNQIMAQCVDAGFKIGEVSCPTKYFPEASSINLQNSAIYGLGCLGVSIRYRLHRWGIWNYGLLK